MFYIVLKYRSEANMDNSYFWHISRKHLLIFHSFIWNALYCSVAQSCLTLCDPMDCSTPDFPVPHHFPELAQASCPLSQWGHPTISSSVVPLCSIFLNIRVFSNKSFLHIRWPDYWSFSFSISPSNEYSGSILYLWGKLKLFLFEIFYY